MAYRQYGSYGLKSGAIVVIASIGLTVYVKHKANYGTTVESRIESQKRVDKAINEMNFQKTDASVIDNQNILGKWQGVCDATYNEEHLVPDLEGLKKEMTERDPFLPEAEISKNATQERNEKIKYVNEHNQRTQGYVIEFLANGTYIFNEGKTQHSGKWKLLPDGDNYEDKNKFNLYLQDNQSKTIYQTSSAAELNSNGLWDTKMPCPANRKGSTMMNKIIIPQTL